MGGVLEGSQLAPLWGAHGLLDTTAPLPTLCPKPEEGRRFLQPCLGAMSVRLVLAHESHAAPGVRALDGPDGQVCRPAFRLGVRERPGSKDSASGSQHDDKHWHSGQRGSGQHMLGTMLAVSRTTVSLTSFPLERKNGSETGSSGLTPRQHIILAMVLSGLGQEEAPLGSGESPPSLGSPPGVASKGPRHGQDPRWGRLHLLVIFSPLEQRW